MAVAEPAPPSAIFPSPNRTPNRTMAAMLPNVANVVLGTLHIKPWYPSFYPEDLVSGRRTDWLYVCQWCFKYTPEIMKYSAHCGASKKVCPLKDEPPPGEVLYEKDGHAIHQLDGEEHKLYSQNLSLFAKLFLETKSVFFDASTFLYYTLVLRDSPSEPGRVVGFFSKEKMSWDNNNVACILVFPPWQRRGLGQVLIASSYALGRLERRFGGPERPLSALGRQGYLAFWSSEVARHLLLHTLARKTVKVDDISAATYILPDDVVAALREMDIAEKRKTAAGSVVINKTKLAVWAEQHRVSLKPLVDLDAFRTGDEEREAEAEIFEKEDDD